MTESKKKNSTTHDKINTVLWIILAIAIIYLWTNGHFNPINITYECIQDGTGNIMNWSIK